MLRGMEKSNSLAHRDHLPDALRVLLVDYPRAQWSAHDNFDGLIRFWLERHLMFRAVLARMQNEAEMALDGNMDGRKYQRQTARLAGVFLNQLQGHHQIEDHHYFPKLVTLERPLERGFAILDADHQALDGHIQVLADLTNTLLNAGLNAGPNALTKQVGALHSALGRFAPFLDRHLVDEEELVVPVLLKHGPVPEA